MKPRSIIVFGSLGVFSSVVGFFIALRPVGLKAQNASVSEITVTSAKSMLDGTGAVRGSSVEVTAFRPDGSSVNVRLVVNGVPSGVKTIVDTSSKTRVAIDPFTESKTTYHLSERELAVYLGKLSSCHTPGQPAGEKVLGYDTVHASHSSPGPGAMRKVSTDEWLATGLNCKPLRSVSTVLESDAPVAITKAEVISVSAGPADPKLFEIPPDYVERAPSEVFAERARRNGTECKQCMSPTSQGLDKAYRRR